MKIHNLYTSPNALLGRSNAESLPVSKPLQSIFTSSSEVSNINFNLNIESPTNPKEPPKRIESPTVNANEIFSDKTLKLNQKSYFHTTTLLNEAEKYLGIYEISAAEYKKLKKENPEELNNTQYRVIGSHGVITDQWCAHTVSYIAEQSGMKIGKHKGSVQNFIDWAGRDYKRITTKNMTRINYKEERQNRANQIKKQLPDMHEGDFIVWKTNSANNGSFIVLLEDGTLQQNERSHIGIIENVDLENVIVTVIEGNANENTTEGNSERITVKTKEDGINGAQKIGEYQEVNRRDGLIRKQYTIQDLANFGYSGYIDNQSRIKKI